MPIEEKLRNRIVSLIQTGVPLSRGDAYDQVADQAQASACIGWIGAADNAIALACPSPKAPYRKMAGTVIEQYTGFSVNKGVSALAALLRELLADIDQGLLTSVADQARAETYDDLLDHAAEYHSKKRLDGSSALATVVFEDTIRRICRSQGIDDKDVKTDQLITALNQNEVISDVVAKRCRGAAGVRNKALHAQLDEITLNDVDAVITLTRELLSTHLT